MRPSSSPAAFVTGASGGIGRALVDALRHDGWRVWGTARDVARLAGIAAEGAPAGAFYPVRLDLDDEEGAEAAYVAAAEAAGGFQLIVNNAGYGVFGPFDAGDFEPWRRQLQAMIVTTARLVHRQLADLRRRGSGTLVNVASLATEFPLPYMAGYNMAKAGLSALSESLQIETAGTDVRVIDFRPGDFRTDFNRSMTQANSTPGADVSERQRQAWRGLERHLEAAPGPARAAADLLRAVRRGRRGVVRSGDGFQARLAPLFQRMVPTALARAVRWRYFGLR